MEEKIDVPQDLYINGLLGVYELNRVELLRDVFEWAYERSASLYSVLFLLFFDFVLNIFVFFHFIFIVWRHEFATEDIDRTDCK